MAFNKLEDTNALLLYRVGPVLMCSPTLQVESVIVPPAISRANSTSDAEPGMFRSMYGMVRVVDLRVRFGVDAVQRKQPGQIVIVEVTGGHAGFWVDEIEDVIAFPQTGWSQVPSHVPGSVFSRALLQENDIRLYAEFDRLDGFKASGYLREHIRRLQQTAKQETDEVQKNIKSAEPVQSQALPSTLNHPATITQTDISAETDDQSISRSANDSSEVKAEKKPSTRVASIQEDDSQHAQPKPGKKNNLSFDGGTAKTRQGIDGSHRSSQSVKSAMQSHKPSVPHEKPRQNITASMDKTAIVGDAGSQKQVVQPASTAGQTGSNWLWWFVPLLLLFVSLFMLMQNSRLLQSLMTQDESPVLQTRVDLEKNTTEIQQEQNLDDDVSQYASSEPSVDTSIISANGMQAASTVQITDDLAETIYIEPGSGDLTITVNDYEEDGLSDDTSPVDASVQSQLSVQVEPDSHQLEQAHSETHETETGQRSASPLPETEKADTKLMQSDQKQGQSDMRVSEGATEKIAAVEDAAVDKAAQVSSRRLQHIVVKGDTLWSITGRYINKPWRYPEIARLSNIDNPHLIYPGQRVTIVLNYKNQTE